MGKAGGIRYQDNNGLESLICVCVFEGILLSYTRKWVTLIGTIFS